jgi:dihydrofolate synthase/folylpolyglutamate synthase
MNDVERYHAAMRFLSGLANLELTRDYLKDRARPDVYLKRMRYFLGLLGHPDRGIQYVHIGGTAGKGTVTAMLHDILQRSGKRVGSFTSPAVTTAIEHIRVGRAYIAPGEFADIVTYLQPYIDEAYQHGPYGQPSYFEILLAIAFVYFRRQRCEWVVLEAGLGGRYDATNVVEHPVVTAITNIDYDHTNILGSTLTQIAYDKAGIIKHGVTCFTTEQRPSIVRLFATICTKQHAPLIQVSRQKEYQVCNRALALSIAEHVGVIQRQSAAVVADIRLPARFEQVRSGPKVVLDGAHNRLKMRSTVENVARLSFCRLILVIGMAADKDHRAMLRQIIPLADHVVFTRFQNKERACAQPLTLSVKAAKYLKRSARTSVHLDPTRALAEALALAHPDDLVLVTGSFYLAGELRARWHPEAWILQHRRSM